MNSVRCPHCSKEFEMSEAIVAHLTEEKLKAALENAEKEKILVGKKTAEETEKRLRFEFELEQKKNETEVESANKRIEKLILDLTQEREEKLSLKEKDQERELVMQKKLAEEKDNAKLEAQKQADEASHLKLLEKDKVIDDMGKQMEEMKRKLQQGSQQTQGEVFELEFEKNLQDHYRNDKILPVGKGIKGGDILQEVWDSNGNLVGQILWELKNTKTWSEGWVDKLKTDKRSVNADDAILITVSLPADMKTAGFRSGIWVTKYEFVFPLCDTIRAKLIQLYILKNSQKGKDEKMEMLYQYLSGNQFKHRMEAIIDSFTSMQQDIEKEKRYFASKWARDEKNLRQVMDSTYAMHGDMKSLLGSGLQEVKGIEMELSD